VPIPAILASPALSARDGRCREKPAAIGRRFDRYRLASGVSIVDQKFKLFLMY
jgi:hypothetical protein